METPWDWNGPIKISVIPALPAVLVYRPLLGDGILDVNLVSTDFTDGWSKIGPAIRDTLDDNSRHGMTAMTGSNGLQFVWRLNPGAGSADSTRPGLTPPKLLQIEKSGDLITSRFFGEWFPGLPWTWLQIGTPQTILMSSESYIGIVVCSHNNGALNTAVFDSLTLTAPPVEFPWNLSPEDSAVGVSLTPTLDWIGGDSATSWDVYFGTDPGALPLVDTVADSEYTPAALVPSTKYYWQVVDQPSGVASAVMSFKTLYEAPWYMCSVLREIWLGMWWAAPIERLLWGAEFLTQPPNWSDELSNLDSPDLGIGDYGGRMSAHLIPGTSGTYTFWIASDDAAELRLNTDDTGVANMERIAYHNDWTGSYEWDKFGTQGSVPIPLVAGQKYYIEALWKEGGGGDHCEVAWEGPDSPSRSVIACKFLTAAFAKTPKPEIRSEMTPLEVQTLSWAPGIHGTQQEVLFGTDPGAMVAIATALPGDTSSIVAPAVASDTTYYWQVNCTDGTDTWTGDVWSFTVSEWVGRNIGQRLEVPSGSSSYDPVTDVTTINATGHELWGDFDEFHFRYTTMKMTRNIGTIQARVLSITPDHWRRGGVMIRESLASTSRKFMMHKTGHDNTRFQVRDNTRAGTWNGPDAWGLGYPLWVRIERNGSNFNAYHSFDGDNWIHRGYAWVPMEAGKPVYLGLAACNHPNAGLGNMTTATFDSLSITTPDPRQAWNLNPPSGSTMVDIHATLSWSPGDGATEHRVYFSADEEAVINRTVAPIVLPAETTSVEVGPLDMGMVYYWAVDELVNPVIPGEVISFTAEDYRTIDDFEAYDIEPEALPDQWMIPGDVLVEAVAPPEQEWVDPQVLDDGPQIVDDPERGLVLALDGIGDWVDCGNPAALNFGTGDWSLSAWIKNTMTGTGDINKGTIIGNGGDGDGGHRYAMIVSEESEGKVTLVLDDDSSLEQAIGAATPVNDGAWHHVLGLREGAEIRIYIDGMLQAIQSLPSATYDLSGAAQHNFLIGAVYHHNNNAPFKDYEGLIDEVRVYDSALTIDDLAYLLGFGGTEPDPGGLMGHWAFEGDFTDSSGNGFDGTPVGAEVKPGYYSPLIAHYAFDEGSGDTATDSSGNGLDGAITDALWTATTADGSAACLDFEGGANVVNEAAGPYLNNLAGLSMSLWIQSDVIDTDKGFIIGRHPEGDDQRGIRYDTVGASGGGDDVIKYGVATNEGADESESSVGIQTTEWQHVVMVWDNDGTGTDLYINGVLDTKSYDGDNRTGLTDGYTKLLVGKGSKDGASDAGWDGRIDDVRVYDYRLSEGEVRYIAGVGDLFAPDTYVPLVAHFEFEGNLDDSTGNNRHGTAHGAIGFETDPDMGDVLDLPGGNNQYVSVPEVGISGNDPTTIACWAKADHTSIPDWTLIFGFTGNAGGGGGCGSHFNIGSIGGPGGIGAHAWCWERTILSDEEALDWRHYAMTYDGTAIAFYGDGILKGKENFDLTDRADRIHVGSRVTQDSSFPGNVEDARVYNIALTRGQIATLGGYVPT
ncbi:MAG: LamG-like jellyroll fold domain-containing protein, partial [Planctomycetota bacterium]